MTTASFLRPGQLSAAAGTTHGANGMLKTPAEHHGKSVAQVILRSNVQRGVIVIPKSTNKERIEENLDNWN